MSSIQVLLSTLQDPIRALATPDSCRTVVLDLLALCQCEEPRHELLNCGGLDVLAGFVASSEATLATLNSVDVLLELLTILACDRHHSAKTRIADKPPLLTFPHALHTRLCTENPLQEA